MECQEWSEKNQGEKIDLIEGFLAEYALTNFGGSTSDFLKDVFSDTGYHDVMAYLCRFLPNCGDTPKIVGYELNRLTYISGNREKFETMVKKKIDQKIDNSPAKRRYLDTKKSIPSIVAEHFINPEYSVRQTPEKVQNLVKERTGIKFPVAVLRSEIRGWIDEIESYYQ